MASDSHGWPWLFGKIYSVLQRNPSSNRVVAESAELRPDERVLDVGCGAGRALVSAAHTVGTQNVAGIDPTSALAATARKRIPGGTVEVGTAEDLPFSDASFDVVWSISSHHHWEDSETGLRESVRVLAPGGRLLLAEHQTRRPDGHGLTWREAEDLMSRFRTLGLEDIELQQRRAGWRSVFIIRGYKPSPAAD